MPIQSSTLLSIIGSRSRLDVIPNRKEKRLSPRRSLNETGWIRLEGGFASRQCNVLDYSETGVRLYLQDAEKIPGTFTFTFSKEALGRRARLASRRGNQISAEFF
jgi:hypothetical protein